MIKTTSDKITRDWVSSINQFIVPTQMLSSHSESDVDSDDVELLTRLSSLNVSIPTIAPIKSIPKSKIDDEDDELTFEVSPPKQLKRLKKRDADYFAHFLSSVGPTIDTESMLQKENQIKNDQDTIALKEQLEKECKQENIKLEEESEQEKFKLQSELNESKQQVSLQQDQISIFQIQDSSVLFKLMADMEKRQQDIEKRQQEIDKAVEEQKKYRELIEIRDEIKLLKESTEVLTKDNEVQKENWNMLFKAIHDHKEALAKREAFVSVEKYILYQGLPHTRSFKSLKKLLSKATQKEPTALIAVNAIKQVGISESLLSSIAQVILKVKESVNPSAHPSKSEIDWEKLVWNPIKSDNPECDKMLNFKDAIMDLKATDPKFEKLK